MIIWANNRGSDGVGFSLDEKKRLAGFQVYLKIKIMGFSSILDVQLEKKNKIKITLRFCLVNRTSCAASTETEMSQVGKRDQQFSSGQNKLAMSTNRKVWSLWGD